MKQIVVDKNLCLYCGTCVGGCPFEALTLYSTWIEVDHDTCTKCGTCVTLCPVGALSLGEVGE